MHNVIIALYYCVLQDSNPGQLCDIPKSKTKNPLFRFASVLKESLSFAPTEKLSMLKEYEDKLKKAIKGFDIVLEVLKKKKKSFFIATSTIHYWEGGP